jgi:hypothetical protein
MIMPTSYTTSWDLTLHSGLDYRTPLEVRQPGTIYKDWRPELSTRAGEQVELLNTTPAAS